MMRSVLLVALGGAAGSAIRYLISVFTAKSYSGSFPLATFCVNILGSLAIGMLMAFFSKSDDGALKLLLVTGFCGGFTTFSAFSHETLQLMRTGQTAPALLYVGASVVLGVIAVAIGYWLVDNTVLKA